MLSLAAPAPVILSLQSPAGAYYAKMTEQFLSLRETPRCRSGDT